MMVYGRRENLQMVSCVKFLQVRSFFDIRWVDADFGFWIVGFIGWLSSLLWFFSSSTSITHQFV